ncbi:MAG: DNA-binding protein [Clostridia bacterium]|nr:DNA-binding protein [Clostridia bacterium]
MEIPRMRTIPEAFRELKAADPNTAYTLRAFRAAVNRGEIPVVCVGNKRLINLDLFFAMLNAPSCVAKEKGVNIRPL